LAAQTQNTLALLLGLVAVMAKKILRKFLVEKNEKGQQFLAFIKVSFQ